MSFDILETIADIVMGQSPPGETCNNTGDGIPLLNGPTEFGSHHPTPVQFTTNSRKRAQPGDILFCVRGSTTGRMNWADREYAIGRGIAALRHKKGAQYQPYLKALVDYRLPDLLAESTGSTFPNVSYSQIAGLRCDILPLPEQRAIARILGALDDKIELNRRMNRTLEEMAKAIFKSWFIDFDPVIAKAEGRKPYGLNDEMAALFPVGFQDSVYGIIPNRWDIVPLPESFDVNPSRKLLNGQIAPYLEMANMPVDSHSPEVWVERTAGSGMRFINGDTLVARITPCLENGKTAYVDFLQEDQVGWGSTEYIVLRPKSPFPPIYAYCLARTDDFRDFAIRAMTGSSGRQRVPAESLKHYQIVKPEATVVETFGVFVNPFFAKARLNLNESRTLITIRDALLPKLLSGEIRIHQAGSFLENTS